jgi:voltage-gated potassium channel
VLRGEAALASYEARSSKPLIALAFAFLALYATQVLWLSAPSPVDLVLEVGQVLIWAVFLADFSTRILLAPRRVRYVVSHPLDVITLVLPMFRPLRALRVFAAARVLIDRSHHVSFGRVAAAIGITATFIMAVGALVVLDYERFAEGASITTLGDAVWWAIVTLTSVGYGDTYPVTGQGRAAAIAMMAVGVSLLGAVTATFAAWFTERVRQPEEDAIAALTEEIRALRAELGRGTHDPDRDVRA